MPNLSSCTYDDESRWIVIGEAAGQCWSAVITYRHHYVQIISVRRSREGEVAIYGG
ncbi:BrnT family toxin [Mycobacterium hodleri]|uniref:BrnT family toxin n=1 Tax=Mycolicibacterium hodleri TaxID=49897 RepID=A0A502DRV0_9MYCO|nr:BrnT family toxin [Mycolicibacterium hodleri]